MNHWVDEYIKANLPNLEEIKELMKGAKWVDFPCDDGVLCISVRYGKTKTLANGQTLRTMEYYRCRMNELRTIVRAANKIVFDYKEEISYYRDPHVGKTYAGYPCEDLLRAAATELVETFEF